jgi:cytochrome c-type biogenesis protein CcmH
MRLALIVLLLLLSMNAIAIVFEEREFASPEQANTYRILTEELRCLVCQNQSLADSEAPLASDLRQQVFVMLNEGADDQEIRAYMVARYGDFVLYRPPVKSTTLVLWFGPFVLAVIGLAVLFVQVRKRRKLAPTPELSEAERTKLSQLLDTTNEPGSTP